jgi:hypothetical protein
LDLGRLDGTIQQGSAHNIDHQEHDSETLSSNVVGKNLNGIADKHTRPCNVVPEVVDVDHSNHSVGCCLTLLNLVSGRADCPNGEGDKHTGGGNDEELATTDFVDEKASSDSSGKVEDLKDLIPVSLNP